ncbi:MAG TPA: hypothetical protein VKU62_03110 [Thermoanaerobaculia bacterium]|nr:hypothetical protein [Thermoanaerobaculia bacterium]
MELAERIERLDKKLRPIADKPVAFGPDLIERVKALPKPLDEADVRAEAERALTDAVDAYLVSDAEQREQIRELFRKNRAFAWATRLPFAPDSADCFRKHLAHFSILDQYPDYRDALLWFWDLKKSPYFESVRDEIAALSSEKTRKLISER